MTATISVPEPMAEALKAFVKGEDIRVEVAPGGEGTVRVVVSDGRAESDLSTLQAGGWIKCEVARVMADKLDASTHELGKLLDFLDVKVRDCGLGCF